jgi:hypothetical protein
LSISWGQQEHLNCEFYFHNNLGGTGTWCYLRCSENKLKWKWFSTETCYFL